MKTVYELNKNEVYLLATLFGFRFCFKVLKKNRNITNTNLSSKQKSIKKLNGCTTPLIVTTAEACYQEGLEIIDPKTKEVITNKHPDWQKILVVIEGVHRLLAYLAIVEKMQKEGQAEILYPKVFCMLPLLDKPIKDQLQDANSEVAVWKGLDFATSLLLENHKDLKPERLEFVKELISEGIGNDAAYILAQLNRDPVPKKQQLVDANENTEKGAKIRADLSKQENLQDAKTLFPYLKRYLGIPILKYRDVTYKITDIYQSISENKVPRIIAFLQSLNATQIKEIQDLKNGSAAAELLGKTYDDYLSKQ